MSSQPVTKFHKARKRFGQNFLQDEMVITRIVNAINPLESDHLVEIGPGLGALTEPLSASCGELDLIELDRDLIAPLKIQFALSEKVHIHQGDALAFDFSTLIKKGKPLRLVGNLPYNISTPLIFHLLTYASCIKDMHFMLQKEVVDRLTASPGEKNYGRLTVMTQYYCSVKNIVPVSPNAFSPVPKVYSAVARLTPHTTLPFPCKDVSLLEQLVRSSFGMRRKKLRNSLKDFVSEQQLVSVGINPSLRAENLSLKEYVLIANMLSASAFEQPK